ncbi:protein FAM32A [Podospora fimiseda]|uniref:Protein FAM32A n=1 Tax=Podospora fimiseda TaxID=252190 RepID=A0AAN7BVK5_9PEZI|nr:protein FAM32A [Podospora fimiseda]
MPSSDYTTVTKGALKLKGTPGITKKKKKKSSKSTTTSDLEKNLSTTGSGSESKSKSPAPPSTTEEPTIEPNIKDDDNDDNHKEKTEAERKFAEVKRKRLKELASSNDPAAARAGVRPELLKTHKQRVEELNSHLSRLSEHHDMPKIGPG